MEILSDLKRVFSLPPHVALQKIVRRLRRGLSAHQRRWMDRRISTYEIDSSHMRLRRFVDKIELSVLPEGEILCLNQKYLSHEFNLLGSDWAQVRQAGGCEVNVSNRAESDRIRSLIPSSYIPVDWQTDFKSGYRWGEKSWSRDIRYGTTSGVDVKIPWELARMQHLVNLAWGYALEQDEKYVQEFRNQLLDFIASNPPRYGVNWVCTMDVGIRIANWLMAYDLFRAYDAQLDPPFEAVFIRSVYEHGKHIFSHLEWDPYLRSNHYLANIAGLLFVAAYTEHSSWLDFAVRELQREVVLQFHSDGSNFEASTSYHRLSAEMVLYSTAIAQELGVEFSREYLDRVEKMAHFIREITKPDGTVVQFGDNDSGRFMKMFPSSNDLDHRYLICAMRGVKDLTSVIRAQLKKEPLSTLQLSSFPDFGLYIQRKGPWFLAVRCGSIGQRGNGGHAHNDQLSFELSIQGVSIIVDPGTYVYTSFPEERRRFRSTAMHNTLAVRGKEQNRDEGLFRMTDGANARVIQFADGLFIGEHRGFGPVHRRTLKISSDSLEGVDEYEGLKEIYFHLAPNWQAEKRSKFEIVLTCPEISLAISTDQGNWEIQQGEISEGYGNKKESLILILTASFERVIWKTQIL